MLKYEKLEQIINENPGLTVKDLAKKTKSNVDCIYVMIGYLKNKCKIPIVQEKGQYFIKKTIAPEIIPDVLNNYKTKKKNPDQLTIDIIISSFSEADRSQYFFFKEKGQNYSDSAESMIHNRQERLTKERMLSNAKV
jgi:hypothetical protein